MKLDVPNWEPSFFEQIDKRAQKAGLTDLRAAMLDNGDLEVRVWIGFGLDPLKGFVFKRGSGHWEATYLRPIDPESSVGNYQQKLPPPKSGWNQFWDQLIAKGILTLPDSSELGDEDMFPDGESNVVEVNTNRTYRTYKYGIPEYQKWPEAKSVVEITEIIFNEFGIKK